MYLTTNTISQLLIWPILPSFSLIISFSFNSFTGMSPSLLSISTTLYPNDKYEIIGNLLFFTVFSSSSGILDKNTFFAIKTILPINLDDSTKITEFLDEFLFSDFCGLKL